MLAGRFNIDADGYTLVVHSKDDPSEVLCFADLVDRTIIVPNAGKPLALEAANLLGAKRFIFNEAVNAENAQQFARDRVMDTSDMSRTEGWTKSLDYLIGQPAIFESSIGRSPDFYNQLSVLFSGAEFTPGKMEEYREGEPDIFCRVNGKHIMPIIMLNPETGSMLGFIRIAIIEGSAYLSDEMIQPEIAKDSPEFLSLLGHLFNTAKKFAAKQGIQQVLIRAAADRVALYETLGCKAASDSIIVPKVIHGPPTPEMEIYIKNALTKAQAALASRASFSTASSGIGNISSASSNNNLDTAPSL